MTHALRHHAYVWWFYLLQALKVKMQYRANFFAELGGTVIYGFVNVALLWVVFSNIGTTLTGWTFDQVLLMYGMGELTFGLFGITSLGFVFSFASHYIIDGHLDRPLLRPINPLLQIIMEQGSMNDWPIILKGIAIMAWALNHSQAVPPETLREPLWWLSTVLVVLGAAATYNGMFFTLSVFSFWLKDRVSLTWPLFDFHEFSRYPLTIFPPGVRLFFSWVLPFGFVAFYPATVVLGIEEYWAAARWIGVVALVSNAAGYLLWVYGLKTYESTGS